MISLNTVKFSTVQNKRNKASLKNTPNFASGAKLATRAENKGPGILAVLKFWLNDLRQGIERTMTIDPKTSNPIIIIKSKASGLLSETEYSAKTKRMLRAFFPISLGPIHAQELQYHPITGDLFKTTFRKTDGSSTVYRENPHTGRTTRLEYRANKTLAQIETFPDKKSLASSKPSAQGKYGYIDLGDGTPAIEFSTSKEKFDAKSELVQKTEYPPITRIRKKYKH